VKDGDEQVADLRDGQRDRLAGAEETAAGIRSIVTVKNIRG
jgi:hypothetical protein